MEIELRIIHCWISRIQVCNCYLASSFGEVINSTTYISLTEDFILITNTTLYCVAEDKTSKLSGVIYIHLVQEII